MNRPIPFIFIFLCLCAESFAQTAGVPAEFNYSSFTEGKRVITPEMEALTDAKLYEHPEYGVLPYNAPCKDCFELLQKRDEAHRYFVKNGSKGKEFYQQTGYNNMSYNDNGIMRTIDSRIAPTAQAGIFKSSHQSFPITVNIPEKFTSLLNEGKELQVNRNVSIYVAHADGSFSSLGEPNWTNYTAGDNGVVIYNIYPGIDLELRTGYGSVESFYHVNKPLPISDGWLVISDNMKVPQGLVYDYTSSEKMAVQDAASGKYTIFYEGSLYVNDASGAHRFLIGAPSASDVNGVVDNVINLNYQVTDNGAYNLYIPANWMNDANRSYPLVIDPLVSAVSTLAPNLINSSYDATCFQNGCANLLNAAVPANAIVTSVVSNFTFLAQKPCFYSQGAWDIRVGSCKYPSVGDPYRPCVAPLWGRCQGSDINIYNDVMSCLPAPNCNASTLQVTLTFYRCVSPDVACAPSCVFGDITTPAPWTVTISGRTAEISSITSDPFGEFICKGDRINLSATVEYNISPYTYTWNPGNLSGSTVSVTPDSTTTYTVTVNSCGGLDSMEDSIKINVGKAMIVHSNDTSSCEGSKAILSANVNSGIPPYAYKWYPGGLSGQTISVSPDSTTIYTVTVTQCLGAQANDSAQATSIVTVIPFYNPGFIIDPDTVCQNNDVTIAGLGTGDFLDYHFQSIGSTYYSWDGQTVHYISYPNPGVYNITLNYAVGNCLFADTQQITVEICAGTEESFLSDGLNIYPNPSTNLIFISSTNSHSDEFINVSVINVFGEILQEEIKKWDNETSINIKALPAGIYFVQVQNERGRWVGRFVKE